MDIQMNVIFINSFFLTEFSSTAFLRSACNDVEFTKDHMSASVALLLLLFIVPGMDSRFSYYEHVLKDVIHTSVHVCL